MSKGLDSTKRCNVITILLKYSILPGKIFVILAATKVEKKRFVRFILQDRSCKYATI